MAKLDCKPRLSPDRRCNSNIWFCAHPEDFEEYFDKITDDLLKKRDLKIKDVAVWFDREPLAEYDAKTFLADLAQMKLFIVAVTRRFLTENSRARLLELKFASDNKIPILPLMLESGLDSLFDEVCGSIQYLDPFVSEGTAISYGDKLNSFLSDIFLDSKLKERIEKEFDATIFLSYRKIDRGYAQDLMDIIHRNKKFRDVAIWYDEFLTPGEDYNTSISDAIKESDAFVMAVTPNIIAQSRDKDGNPCENYIVTTEYPLAYELGKPIIPYEIVHTGMRLHSKFPKLPYYIPEGCIDSLYEDLEFKLSDIPLGAKQGNPEHDYLIGLAYFTGTCVELNKQKGIELLESAAENGNMEAANRLSIIYSHGDGVEKNYNKRIELCGKIIDIFKGKLDSADNLTREGVDHYIESYVNACKVLCSTMLFQEQLLFLDVTVAEMRKYYDKLKDLTPRAIDILSGIYGIYTLYAMVGNDRESKKRYSAAALDLAMRIMEHEPSKTNLFNLSVTLLNLTKYSFDDKNYKEAEDFGSRALDIAEKVLCTEGNIEDYLLKKYVLSSKDTAIEHYLKCCGIYAKINFILDNAEKATEYLQKALKIAEPFIANDRHRGCVVNYTESASALMTHYLNKNDQAAAKEYYLKTLSAFDKIEEKSFGRTSDDTAVFLRLGAYLESELNYSVAEKYYLRALKIYDYPTENMMERSFAASILINQRLENVSKKSGSQGLAQNYRNRAEYFENEFRSRFSGISVSYVLSALNSEIFCLPNNNVGGSSDNEVDPAQKQYCLRLYSSAQSHIKSGSIHLSVGNTEKAKENFRKAVDILRDISKKDPENSDFSSALSDAEEKLISADSFRKEPEKKQKKSFISIFKRK